jgi:anti-sigma factor RsiW
MSLDDQELSARIRRHATRHRAPDALRAGIRTQIAVAEAGRAATPERALSPRRAWFALRWPTATVSFAMGLSFALLVLPIVPRLGLEGPTDATLVADHVRALGVGPLTEVVSTDRHTVKPWFQGRIDYAPPVFDLAADGFPLIGGRIEHLRGDRVATLAYASNRHVIDVFVWPSDARTAPVPSVHKGFNLLHWADGSMQYWAVSDVERAEMARFARLWQERVTAQ